MRLDPLLSMEQVVYGITPYFVIEKKRDGDSYGDPNAAVVQFSGTGK